MEKHKAATMVEQCGWDAWTEKRAAVKSWQKGRTRPNPDPTLKTTMDDKTEQFKKAAREKQKKLNRKASVKPQCWHDTFTILAILQTDGR